MLNIFDLYHKQFHLYFFVLITGKVGRNSCDELNVYHYLTEAAKFAASYRMELGDPDDHSEADVVSRLC